MSTLAPVHELYPLPNQPESPNVRALATAMGRVEAEIKAMLREPTVSVTRAQTEDTGTVVVTLDDPDGRVLTVEFQTQEGVDGTPSAWIPSAGAPHTGEVALLAGNTSTIRWRYTYAQRDGTEVTIEGPPEIFVRVPDAAGLPMCLVRMVSATSTQVRYQVAGYDAQGVPCDVQLVAYHGNATDLNRVSGAAVGAAVASSSEWLFNRPAPGSSPGQLEFSTVGQLPADDTDFATLPEQGRDTVGLSCIATVIATSNAEVTVRVTVDDPQPDGATGDYISLAVEAIGVGGVTVEPGAIPYSTPLVVADGGHVDFTISRAAFRSGTGRVVFTATAANRVMDSDAVDVPVVEQDTIASRVTVQVTATTATTMTLTVVASSPVGTPAVALLAKTANVTVTGFGIGVYRPSATSWTVTRPAFGAGNGQVRFGCVLAGATPDEDTVEIPEQGRDTVSLQLTLTVLSSTATQITVRATWTDPVGIPSGSYTLTPVAAGVSNPYGAVGWGGTNAPISGVGDYTFDRPLEGQPTGRVTFTITDTGGLRTKDSDSVDIPAQDNAPTGVATLSVDASGAVTCALTGPARTQSWKLMFSTSAYPSESDVGLYGTTYFGRIASTGILTTLTLGQPLYVTAIPYTTVGALPAVRAQVSYQTAASSKTIRFPALGANVESNGVQLAIDSGSGALRLNYGAGGYIASFYMQAPMPEGATITGVRAYGYHNALGTIYVSLQDIGSGSKASVVSFNTTSDPSGWGLVGGGTQFVSKSTTGARLAFVIGLQTGASDGDSQISWLELDYYVPDHTKTY